MKNNIGIFGSGTIDWGLDGKNSKNLFKELEKANEKIKGAKKRIMVTHMHPRDSVSEFSGFPGSNGVKYAIKKLNPDIAICAHIHEAGGVSEKIGKTKVIHVARQAAIFDI
jgi:Icc-related predicted phosphoesterase